MRRKKHIKKEDVLKVVRSFHTPMRMSWIVKGFNHMGIIPNENEIREHLESLNIEGKIRVAQNALGNYEYMPIREVTNGKEEENTTL